MDPDLLTYVRLSAGLDTSGTPVAVMATQQGSARVLVLDLVAEADVAAVEERVKGIEWAPYEVRFVPLHSWADLGGEPRTLVERVHACQHAQLEAQARLEALVRELQADGPRVDPTWPSDVQEYVRSLLTSFVESAAVSPEEGEAAAAEAAEAAEVVEATDPTTAAEAEAPAPTEEGTAPATETAEAPAEGEAVPEETSEGEGEAEPSPFVKRPKGRARKGKK